ncbi:MAG: MFS transporter [Planctomycetes bacterium]|nr:MFS transporter [Planctomycetota bacterium]
MQNKSQKLSIREKIGYGLGDMASNLFFQVFILFLLYFYTDVFGISAVAAGTMFLVTRIWDAVNDPIMGAIADRTNTRWGKFRPYLLWFALPFGIAGVMMFTTPDFGPVGKLIYAYITYTLMMMVYTIVNVPYSALMGVITPSSTERTVVSSFRFVSAFIGMFIVQYSVLRMVEVFGGENEAVGWQRALMVLSGFAVILLVITFATTKERVQPPKGQKNSLKQDIADLSTNTPWLLIGGATVFQLTYLVIRGGSIMYYFEYFVQGQEITLFGNVYNFSFGQLVSAYMLSGTVVTILGAILTKWISSVFGKAGTYAGFLAISGISTAMVYALNPHNILALFALQLITSFAIGPVSVLQWAIYTDTADYSEWKKGRRATALIMAASLFTLKLGVALGGAILAWVLAGYGYKPNVQQSSQALQGIRMSMSFYPAMFAIAGAILMVFYPLNKTKMKTMEADLIERRKQNEQANQ